MSRIRPGGCDVCVATWDSEVNGAIPSFMVRAIVMSIEAVGLNVLLQSTSLKILLIMQLLLID